MRASITGSPVSRLTKPDWDMSPPATPDKRKELLSLRLGSQSSPPPTRPPSPYLSANKRSQSADSSRFGSEMSAYSTTGSRQKRVSTPASPLLAELCPEKNPDTIYKCIDILNDMMVKETNSGYKNSRWLFPLRVTTSYNDKLRRGMSVEWAFRHSFEAYFNILPEALKKEATDYVLEKIKI
jgi:hypothetical protein